MNFALLSEVWPDMVQKPKKKKLKRKKIKDPLMDPPLSPDEMDTELLDDDNNENEELDPRRKLKGMRVSPYTDNEIHYQNIKKTVDLDLNENIVRPDKTREYKKSYEDDPEYFDKPPPSNKNSKLTFEYESDELSEWLQKIADMLGIKGNDEFDLKTIENRIREIGENK